MKDPHDQYETWDAAYVLGSLSSNERREYETHLAGCDSCRTSVGELSGMPALLAMLSPDDVAAIDTGDTEPPPLRPQLLDGVLFEVRRRRRRGRWITWTVAAAAAAVLAVGILVAIKPATFGTPHPAQQVSTTAVAMTPVMPSSFEGTVEVTPMGWGTHVEMTCMYHEESGAGAGEAQDGDKLAMYAVGRDGSRVQLATWMAHEGESASPTGSTSMPMAKIAAVQVVAFDTGEVLLQHSL
ncbi:zf-HC2 domain-containing protein [Mycobacterium sp. CVI_P3]|uniref:Zf-HC2 domain-containing protein n=1 Tax=Mycobacterium pinniadriaticum TaxID=2994102 RepID=A0ABT3SNK1_9MYCO|nr:zf-HC2 domain-containing protein [Mycobacterium pinniadriaticum]MCX2934677.1 zf-HC2 domain-containing protein [Mycobacterium pinniadriaticum]MCX2941099.1 zf-HC2 domain-containing protein [Mycobacterium pinniadriaticum]